MGFLYKTTRVGKNGQTFSMYKIRTLKEGAGNYAHEREYTWCGRFLRKWRLDELPQCWNMLNGTMSIFGPRPREEREINLYPKDIRDKLLSVKPGLLCLSGIYFMEEEHILKLSEDPNRDYFEKILPSKITLDMFYIDHKCFFLKVAILYMALKARIFNK